MKSVRPLAAILILSVISTSAHAISAEEERLRGFAEHQKNNVQFDKAREQGEKAYFEEQEQWDLSRNRDLQDYRKTKKNQAMADNGPEAREDELEKKKYQQSYDKARREYISGKTKDEILERRDKNLPTEAQELGLDQTRPRYDYKKRAYFGGKSKVKSSGSSFGGSSNGGSSFGGGGTSFPPPPTFDDFDNGYVPAPNISPDDFGDVPPPPPPPAPMPGGFDPGFGGDGIPVPPAPPFPEDSDF